MKNTQRIFNNYQKLLVPLFEAFGEFESQFSHLQLNSEGRQVKHEITLDPACEANGWKFTMNLSYDLSENKNKEEVSRTLNLLISEGADPLSKNE
tara:strand:- start:70 stop:354 length:285 start_codon:yes stop_codon:yes gene_type:complete